MDGQFEETDYLDEQAGVLVTKILSDEAMSMPVHREDPDYLVEQVRSSLCFLEG